MLAPAVWAVDLSQKAGASAPLPTKPLDGQKRPPCSGWQVNVNGGCWLKIQPPDGQSGGNCPSGYYSHANACYVPVAEAPAIPVVITQ